MFVHCDNDKCTFNANGEHCCRANAIMQAQDDEGLLQCFSFEREEDEDGD